MGDAFMPAKARRHGRKLKTIEATFTLDAGVNPAITSHLTLAEAGLSAAIGPTADGNAGNYLFTTTERFGRCVGASASYNPVADNVDLYAQRPLVSNAESATLPITARVRLKTGATSTNPPATPNGGTLTVTLTFEDSPSRR